MPCTSPQPARYIAGGGIEFLGRSREGRFRGGEAAPLQLPCGRCQGCRLDRSLQWAIRCMHEAACHEANCFLTLTYSAEHLPPAGSLHYRDYQLFFKRLRKAVNGRRRGAARVPLRFFMCGEYGSENSRPHYHALVFGWRPADLVVLSSSAGTFTSAWLEKVWGLGQVVVGDVTFQSASYVARYIFDKQDGELSSKYDVGVDLDSGEIVRKVPEFCQASRRPAIGLSWFERFAEECVSSDSVVMDGKEFKLPRYYDKQLKRWIPDHFKLIQQERIKRASDPADNTDSRLSVKAAVTKARLALGQRNKL